MTMLSPVAREMRAQRRAGCGRCRGRWDRPRCARPRARRPAARRSPAARRRARNCARLTNGSMPQLAEDPLMHRARSARCWRSGSLGAVPPAAAVVQDMLVRQRDAELRRPGSAPATVITWPERDMAAADSSLIARHRSAGRGARKTRVFSQIADQDDQRR